MPIKPFAPFAMILNENCLLSYFFKDATFQYFFVIQYLMFELISLSVHFIKKFNGQKKVY